MKTYLVTIRAIVTKTLEVEADNENAAAEQAHQLFEIGVTEEPEDYEQDTMSVYEKRTPE